MTKTPQIEQIAPSKLKHYEKNARTHSPEQIDQIVASIREFGFTNPVLVGKSNIIIAGHGRVMAAKKIGLKSVPCLRFVDMTEEQIRAYVIADNKLALNAGWDEELLKIELEELKEAGFDIELLGFMPEELNRLLIEEEDFESSPYTSKIEVPTYEITGEKPTLESLYDESKTRELVAEIENADIPEAEKAFLIKAAQRHLVFDYSKIAEYYAHASPLLQALMERSALVIIDFDKAIEFGYVNLREDLEGLMDHNKEEVADEASEA